MSTADEIRKFAELRDAGQISEAEYQAAKERLLRSGAAADDRPLAPLNRLRRATKDRWLGGVCGGLAALTRTESWIWRLLFVIALCFAGVGPVIYLLLWIFVPADDSI